MYSLENIEVIRISNEFKQKISNIAINCDILSINQTFKDSDNTIEREGKTWLRFSSTEKWAENKKVWENHYEMNAWLVRHSMGLLCTVRQKVMLCAYNALTQQ